MAANNLAEQLRRFGLTYPETHLKRPWPGHLDLAVRDKTFAYLPSPDQPFSLSVKLRSTRVTAPRPRRS